MKSICTVGIAVMVAQCTAVARLSAQTLDETVARFWTASSDDVGDAVARILEMDAGFDAVYASLASSNRFRSDVPTGRSELVRTNTNGQLHRYLAVVPAEYDPENTYPVRVYLHGGVRRPEWDAGGRWWSRYDELVRNDEIAVFPAAWNESIWWQASQVENLGAILRDLKARYNIDNNRVYLFGVSDGGTGAYFQAFKAPTPWAAFIPMIGHPAVLANPRAGTDGELYPVNLWNRPFYVFNGETDRLYPVRLMRPWVQFFEGRGVDITFRPVDAGHTVEWWPEEAPGIERFIAAKRRQPHPERLVWETERTDRYNRLHWFVIDELGPPGSQPEEVRNDPFAHSSPSGRIEAERHGNDVYVESQGVARFTILFSPDVFDFDSPVTVTVNGTESFDGMLRRDVRLLLRWADKDRDRTMLYGAAEQIVVR